MKDNISGLFQSNVAEDTTRSVYTNNTATTVNQKQNQSQMSKSKSEGSVLTNPTITHDQLNNSLGEEDGFLSP